MKRLIISCLTAAAVGAFSPAVSAGQGRSTTIEQRAQGAERVVVASVQELTSAYEKNEYGDQLIVSHARLKLEEVLKGRNEPATLVYEGGTVNGMTMRVSSLPTLEPGERAVFFMTRTPKGEFQPYLRGQGILKLDANNRVPGSSLSLDDIRRRVAAGVQ